MNVTPWPDFAGSRSKGASLPAQPFAAVQLAPPEVATVRVSGVDVVRGGRYLLSGIDLTVRPGEHWALLGPNGAGKSTLLSLLGARVHPTHGSVRLRGSDRRTRSRICAGRSSGRQIGIRPRLVGHRHLGQWCLHRCPKTATSSSKSRPTGPIGATLHPRERITRNPEELNMSRSSALSHGENALDRRCHDADDVVRACLSQ